MQDCLPRLSTLCAALALSATASAATLPAALVADATYEGQATMLGSMPPVFNASARFKVSQDTALCPEAMHYQKLTDEQFLTPIDSIESGMRLPQPENRDAAKAQLEFHLESEICKPLKAGTEVEVIGAQLPVDGCMKAWMPLEYNLKYPRTSSYSCFYIPVIISGGQKYQAPSMHLAGFEDWASKEWQKHKVTP